MDRVTEIDIEGQRERVRKERERGHSWKDDERMRLTEGMGTDGDGMGTERLAKEVGRILSVSLIRSLVLRLPISSSTSPPPSVLASHL